MTQIAQVAIAVTDLTMAAGFYSNVLRLEHAFSAPNVIAYSLGTTRLLLTLRPDYVAPDEAGILIYLAIADLQRSHAELLAAGVGDAGAPHVVARMNDTEIWIAFIRDPFGNVLGLIEERLAVPPPERDDAQPENR